MDNRERGIEMRVMTAVALVGLLLPLGMANAAPPASPTRTQVEGWIRAGSLARAEKGLDRMVRYALARKVVILAHQGKVQQALSAYAWHARYFKVEDVGLLTRIAWASVKREAGGKVNKARTLSSQLYTVLRDRRVVGLVARMLQSKDFSVKMEALSALAAMGDSRASRSVLPLLQDRNPYIRTRAALTLGKLGHRAGEKYLSQSFLASSRRERFRGAVGLGMLKVRKPLRYLRRQLKVNRNRRARAQIVEALSALGDRSGYRPTIRDLRTGSETTRLIALRLVEKLKIKPARSALRNLLRDRSAAVRIAAAKCLGILKRDRKRSLKVLVRALRTERSDALRAAAAEGMGEFKLGAAAKRALTDALRDSHLIVRIAAATTLARRGSQAGLLAVREGLTHGNSPLKVLAAAAVLKAVADGTKLTGRPVVASPATVRVAFVAKPVGGDGGSFADDAEPEPGSAKAARRRAARGKAKAAAPRTGGGEPEPGVEPEPGAKPGAGGRAKVRVVRRRGAIRVARPRRRVRRRAKARRAKRKKKAKVRGSVRAVKKKVPTVQEEDW